MSDNAAAVILIAVLAAAFVLTRLIEAGRARAVAKYRALEAQNHTSSTREN